MRTGSLFLLFYILTINLYSQNQHDANDSQLKAMLHPDGSGWGFYEDTACVSKKKKVLLIGDSMLSGYGDLVKSGLKDIAVVDFWKTGLHEAHPDLFPLLDKASSHRKYDIIHFNIGLHGWPKGRVDEDKYVDLMNEYVDILKKNNPNAILVWSMTTPVLSKNSTELDPEINPIIVRRNKKADRVMKSQGVHIIDLYSVMIPHREYSRGDGFHWNRAGQQIQADAILSTLKSLLSSSVVTACCKMNLRCSILGDSYSTYGGFVYPETNRCFYNGENKNNDVTDVSETWWYQILLRKHYLLEINNSYSGSTVCNTGYGGKDASAYSFLARMKNLGRPDIIFVYGGTNDSWANSPIGEYKFQNISEDDLKSFRPAFAYMIDYLLKHNPNAQIYNIVNSELKPEIIKSIAYICNYYNVKNIMLSTIDKPFNGHPSKKDMSKIADEIILSLDKK